VSHVVISACDMMSHSGTMALVQLDLTDTRPAAILRLVGEGKTARDAAAEVGINRKTVERWRQRVSGFGDAYDLAAQLSRDNSPEGRGSLDLLVRTWAPGGMVSRVSLEGPALVELREVAAAIGETSQAALAEPPSTAAEPEPPRAERPACVEPDVLDARGEEISTQVSRRNEPSPYTTVRPPTRDEWLAEMAKLSLDKSQPERVRAVAIAAVSSGLNGGPVRVRPAELEDVAGAAARERGREPGVPAGVWQEARKNFLGPAPDPAPEAQRGGDIVEFEQAKP
jgi:hypothetical protein